LTDRTFLFSLQWSVGLSKDESAVTMEYSSATQQVLDMRCLLNPLERLREKSYRRSMMAVSNGSSGLSGAGACMTAFEQNAQLEACQHHIPIDGSQVALAAFAVMRH